MLYCIIKEQRCNFKSSTTALRMKQLRIITICLALFFAAQKIFAQTDSLNKKNDSINTAILNDYNKKIQEIEKLRLADSAKKAELEEQLNSLKTTDNLKKEEL